MQIGPLKLEFEHANIQKHVSRFKEYENLNITRKKELE
jgi:hypothetical protein